MLSVSSSMTSKAEKCAHAKTFTPETPCTLNMLSQTPNHLPCWKNSIITQPEIEDKVKHHPCNPHTQSSAFVHTLAEKLCQHQAGPKCSLSSADAFQGHCFRARLYSSGLQQSAKAFCHKT